MNKKTRLIIGMTGSSGVTLGVRLMRVLKDKPHVETHLVISSNAAKVIQSETSYRRADVEALANFAYEESNLEAPLASGSFLTSGMIVAPCSMKTLAGIANGYSENLILRAADVTLKEGRKLLLLVRESPLSAIHLENMLKLARLGVVILPPVPGFYARPRKMDDIIDFTVGRILDVFQIEHTLFTRWGEK
ncbi:MAG: UbiX family flavin prenyltransferase [Candidatus Bathyarchaeia archaeon]